MTRDEVLAICLSLPAAEETYPFGEEVAVIKVGGKMFALVTLVEEPGSVNLKCDPVQALELREMYPGIADKNQQQMRAYREMPEADLFDHQWVRVTIGPEDLPGYKADRVTCQDCGESISFQREVARAGRILCRACAGERYYEPL